MEEKEELEHECNFDSGYPCLACIKEGEIKTLKKELKFLKHFKFINDGLDFFTKDLDKEINKIEKIIKNDKRII